MSDLRVPSSFLRRIGLRSYGGAEGDWVLVEVDAEEEETVVSRCELWRENVR